MNIQQIKAAAEIAKTRTSDKRWLAAIDKAVDALTNGKWIVTELANCHVITSASGETYKVSAKICQCKSFFFDRPCAHHRGKVLAQFGNRLRPTLAEVKDAICHYFTFEFEISDAKRRWIETEIERLNEKARKNHDE